MSKQGRIRTQEMRKAQEEAARKSEQRRRILSIVGVLAIVGLIVAIAIVVVRAAGGSDDPPVANGPLVAPANLNTDGGIPVGADDAPVTVTLYFDYMCPACGAFEQVNGEDLTSLLDAGTVELDLRPVSFLDRMSSGTAYSTRSANAIAATADGSLDDVWAFHQALYAGQPEEGSEGLTDDEIADIAESAGVPADVVETFTDEEFQPWVVDTTETAFESISGTPTVLIDGEEFEDWGTPGALADAIESAAA